MPYYSVGDYYGRGDYYRGDPGLFGSIGKIFKGAAKVVGGAARGFLTGGPLGAVTGGLGALVPRPAASPVLMAAEPPSIFQPGGAGIRLGLGREGLQIGAGTFSAEERKAMGLKRRRMNPMNVRALRRASRRIDGFARTARKALKHTPFVLVSRSSRGRAGSPGVITRSEAARALKR